MLITAPAALQPVHSARSASVSASLATDRWFPPPRRDRLSSVMERSPDELPLRHRCTEPASAKLPCSSWPAVEAVQVSPHLLWVFIISRSLDFTGEPPGLWGSKGVCPQVEPLLRPSLGSRPLWAYYCWSGAPQPDSPERSIISGLSAPVSVIDLSAASAAASRARSSSPPSQFSSSAIWLTR